jgi:hypothetical protein
MFLSVKINTLYLWIQNELEKTLVKSCRAIIVYLMQLEKQGNPLEDEEESKDFKI